MMTLFPYKKVEILIRTPIALTVVAPKKYYARQCNILILFRH